MFHKWLLSSYPGWDGFKVLIQPRKRSFETGFDLSKFMLKPGKACRV